jgi:folate-binding protein YgfZ
MKQRVLLRGSEGLDLLHRISTADIKHLKWKEKREGLLLNAGGKILCWFEIELQDAEEAELTYAGDLPGILDGYTFGERYTLEPMGERTLSEADPIRSRIEALQAAPGMEFQTDGTMGPLEVNLRHAIAEQKGCYPGQEVVEKIISLGSPARRLCRVRSDSALSPAFSILTSDSGAEAGVITSRDGEIGLAIIGRIHLKKGARLHAGSQEVWIESIAP